MTVVTGIGVTHFCKSPDCTNESRSSVGRYSYCDECRTIRERNAQTSQSPKAALAGALGGMEAKVKALQAAAKNADKLAAHAKKLTEQALAAKSNADNAADEVRRIARELTGE